MIKQYFIFHTPPTGNSGVIGKAASLTEAQYFCRELIISSVANTLFRDYMMAKLTNSSFDLRPFSSFILAAENYVTISWQQANETAWTAHATDLGTAVSSAPNYRIEVREVESVNY